MDFIKSIDKQTAALILYATQYDKSKMNTIINEVASGRKMLAAIYPGEGEEPQSDFEYIGDIIDGALYMTKAK